MSLQTNIYDSNVFFAIIYQGQRTFILEPKGWELINNHIPRDPQWFGFTSDFLEDKYGMLFSFINDKGITGGGALLQSIYEPAGKGPNEEVFFQFGLMVSNTPQLLNQWRINLNEYSVDRTVTGGVNTVIEKMPFQAKYRVRDSAPCTINNYNNMDGGLLTPISSWDLRLHSKTLLETTEAITQSPQTTNEYVDNGSASYIVFIQPDLTNQPTAELQQVFNQPAGLINTGTTSGTGETSDIFLNKVCQYIPTTSGVLDIVYKGNLRWWSWNVDDDLGSVALPGLHPNACWVVTPRVIVQRVISGVATIISTTDGTPFNLDRDAPGWAYPIAPPAGYFPQVTNAYDRGHCNSVPYEWSEHFENIQVEANDCVYVQLYLAPHGTAHTAPLDYSGLLMTADNYFNTVEFTQLTVTPSTVAPSYRIFDVITQLLENITGQKNGLISEFFSPGGYGYKYLITNGYGIRNFGGPAYQMKAALNSILSDVQATFCVGMGFKTIDGVDYMVIEKVSDFFKDRTIGVYRETFQWKEKNSTKYTYNKAAIGFNKYEGLNLVQQDEFCTEGSYLLQNIIYNNNTLSKKANWIAAGYIIESQRRNQFLANPGQKLTFDDDIFIIATAEPCVFDGSVIGGDGLPLTMVFGSTYGTVRVNLTSLALLPGDKIKSTTGVNSGTEFTIVGQFPGYPIIGYDLYYVSPTPVNEIIASGFTIIPPSPNQIFAERNQPFKICENVIDPSTIYNGRLSMSHILFNWREVLGIGFYFLDPTSADFLSSKIVPTLVKMNSLFTTQFLPTEPNKGNVGDLVNVEINRIDTKNYLKNGSSIFTPKEAECMIKIGWNEMNIIRQALSGELNDDTKDFGGVVLADDENNLWFCHIMDILYNLKNQMATLQVQKLFPVTL